MKRSCSRNKVLNKKITIDRRAYNNHFKLAVRNENQKKKKEFGFNLDTKTVTDNRIFLKTNKPFLSQKLTKSSKINLNKNEKIISCNE